MKAIKHGLLILTAMFLLSSCATTVGIVHQFSDLADAIVGRIPDNSARVEEAYDTYMTTLLKGYTVKDFIYINKHSTEIAMNTPYRSFTKQEETYRIIPEVALDIANAKHIYKLPKSKKLPQGGFYVCGSLYNIPVKVKDVIQFRSNICDPDTLSIYDYCPNWSILRALENITYQNHHTVFIFNKKGVLQKVVTSFKCPARLDELEF